MEKKDGEIDLLNKQISELQKQLQETEEQKTESKETTEEPKGSRTKPKANKVTTGTNYSTGDFNQLKRNTKLYEKFEAVAKNLRDNYQFPSGTEENVREYFIATKPLST